MAIQEFPPVDLANEFGLLAVGGDLEPESLHLAYKSGIFPWPMIDEYLTWFAPEKRAVLFLEDLHISKSLKRQKKRGEYSFHFNRNFDAVIKACAELPNRKMQEGTWITEDVVHAYIDFHKAGYCHSIECYKKDFLVGGLYGVSIGKMFAGESMFYYEPNASKLAFWHLLEYLANKEVTWIDCQMMTPLLKNFGAVEIERDRFMELLEEAVSSDARLF